MALRPNPRPECEAPTACRAKGNGLCRRCNIRSNRNLSEASKRALADPEVRARMSEASKRAWADPEVRARMSEARKRAWAESGRELPNMSADRRKLYLKLRPLVGRDAALAEVFKRRGAA